MGRILSSLGIGAAEVDLVLPKTKVRQGESLDGTIEVVGGDEKQDIEEIYFALQTRYVDEDGDRTVGTVLENKLTESFTISPGEERTMDGTLSIPHRTPISKGNTEVWIRTGLDISVAVDPKDKDLLMVEPSEQIQALLDAFEELGFVLRETENMADPAGRYAPGEAFIQEFEFVPSAGPFADDLDEVEAIPRPSADGVNVFLEIDHDANFLSEITDTDEEKTQFSYSGTDASSVADAVKAAIDDYV
jgi:sporulation-control protein